MATKVKPSRLQVSGTPQAGQVPVYVNEDCFQWCASGGCAEWGCITGTLCDQTDLQGALDCKADCSAIPTDNCQLANGCGYTTCTGTVVVSDLTPYAKSCDLCTVATTGEYCDLTGTPTIPTDNCQLANGCGYTTCTGTLTSSNISNVIYGPSWNGIVTDAPSKDVVYDKLKTYDAIIPSAATCSNQLADKDYVNDSINSVSAYYITKNAQGDQWATYAELAAATTFYSGGVVRVPTRNDYTVVLDDENHSHATTRYSYQGSSWEYQYTINETPMTQAQLDALNSGITAAKVSAYDAIPIITDNCQIANGCGYTTCTGTVSTCSDVISALGYTPYSTGNPCNYINNFAGVISALGYTPYNATNPCGYTTCTGTLVASDLTPYAKTCDLPDFTCYQTISCMVCNLTSPDDSHYPTAKAVADAMACAGVGDMLKSVYDPNSVEADVYDYCYFINTPTIPTDNCQLANGCGYTTCTGTVVASDLNAYATTASLCAVATSGKYCDLTGTPTIPAAQIQSDWTQTCNTCKDFIKNKPSLCTVATSGKYCDLSGLPTIPTNNNQLTNGCGYTTCTGTLSSCADIVSALGYTPYSSANPNGYTTCTGTLSSCADVISALGYTPYSSANPSGYTTCTGTLVASDLTPYAKSCDLKAVATSGCYCDLTGTPTIPTDNCQLSNGCGYTTCTGTISTCSQIISTLGYTPYNCTNPAGYTTCTGTLSATNTGCNGQVLTKTSSGATWCDASGGGDVLVSTQCCNILTSGMSIWAGCQCDYDNLGTYDNNTVYLTI